MRMKKCGMMLLAAALLLCFMQAPAYAESGVSGDAKTEALAPLAPLTSLTSVQLIVRIAVQFLVTLAGTLLIEGLLLLPFGFSLKNEWKPVLLINLATQVVLTVTVGATLLEGGYITAMFMTPPVEIAVTAAETLLYRKILSDKTTARRTAYGMTANLASWLISILLMPSLYALLSSIL